MHIPQRCYNLLSQNNIPQPPETRVINEKGEDVTDQEKNGSGESDKQDESDKVPVVDMD